MVGKTYLMAGAAIVALMQPGIGRAQVTAKTASEAVAPVAPVAVQSAATPDTGSALGEVVVTAQRRQESASKVPLTVISDTGAQLTAAGVADTRDLVRVVPGFVFASQNAWSSPAIRGVSSSVVSPGGEGPVATYIDGVYEPSQQGAYADLPDVDHVEVTKGPQGTLFGRNATAGAVQVFTRGPTFAPHAEFSAASSGWLGGAGESGAANLALFGFVSGPLWGDKLAGSLSISDRSDGGYSHNDITNGSYGAVRDETYRLKLLFKPVEKLTISGGVVFTHRYDEEVTNGGLINGYSQLTGVPGAVTPTQWDHVAYNGTTPHLEYSEYAVHLTEALDVGLGTLSNTTTFRSLTDNIHINVAGVGVFPSSTLGLKCYATIKCLDYEVIEPDESYTDELLFTSRKFGGMITFIAGVFAYHDNASGDYLLNNYPGSPFPGGYKYQQYAVFSDSIAGFASTDIDLTKRLHVSLGGRVTSDSKKEPKNTTETSIESTNFSPRASVRYDWTDQFNTYFTYSRGFRSGVYSTFTAPPIKPEILSSFEVGAKYESGRARVNLSAFYYDYKNLQLSTFVGTGAVQANASATIYGLDVDGEFRLTEHFKLRGGASFLPEAKYNTYQGAIAFDVSSTYPLVQYNGTSTCGSYCGIDQLSVNAGGARMLKAPKLTAFAGLNYTTSTPYGRVEANLSPYYTSSYNYDVLAFIKTNAYATLDVDASFSPDKLPGVKVGVFVKNLTNERWNNGILIGAAAIVRYFSPPTELGARISYKY